MVEMLVTTAAESFSQNDGKGRFLEAGGLAQERQQTFTSMLLTRYFRLMRPAAARHEALPDAPLSTRTRTPLSRAYSTKGGRGLMGNSLGTCDRWCHLDELTRSRRGQDARASDLRAT